VVFQGVDPKTNMIPSDLRPWLWGRNSDRASSTGCPSRGGLASVLSALMDATEEMTNFRRELRKVSISQLQ